MAIEGNSTNPTSYREMLQKLEQESQKSYDKTVLTLSGGALGLSITFISDIIGSRPVEQIPFIIGAWITWGISVACVLFSFFFSQRALKKAVDQYDNGEEPKNIYDQITSLLNISGGVLFIVGVVLIVVFVSSNLA